MPITLEEERSPPNLLIDTLPEGERPSASIVRDMTFRLAMHVENFEWAVGLFEYVRFTGPLEIQPCTEETMIKSFSQRAAWAEIAARDAVMTLYHIEGCMNHSKRSLGLCPTLSRMVDHPKLRKALKDFRTDFPNVQSMRDAVGHAADLFRTTKTIEENIIKEAQKTHGVSVTGATPASISISGSNYVVTFRGKIFGLEISPASAQKLKTIANTFYSAFDSADAILSTPAE